MRLWFAILALCGALAKPLQVDLDSGWRSPPHGLEVLESIASQNSSAFFPLLTVLLAHEEEEGKFGSDEELSSFLFSRSHSLGFLSEAVLPIAKANVALRSSLAAIQAQYQYFDEYFLPSLNSDEFAACDNVLYYDGTATCDPTSVFTFETVKNRYPDAEGYLSGDDHIIGLDPDAPEAILYADVASPDFPTFHSHLLASALEKKISYVLRFKPSSNSLGVPAKLAGYGVTVQLKRTDYLVMNDRPFKGSQDSSDYKLDMDAPNKISPRDLPQLPLRAASFVLDAKDQFDALVNVTMNMPDCLKTLSSAHIDKALVEDADANKLDNFFPPGTNMLVINGRTAISGDDADPYKLLELLSEEVKAVEDLEKLGVPSSLTLDIFREGLVKSEVSAGQRFDYRSPAVTWLNDLEKGPQYKQWPKSLEPVAGRSSKDVVLPRVGRNINNIVLAIDFERLSSLQIIAQVFQLISRGVPVRIGIVPLEMTPAAQYFLDVSMNGSYFSRQAYLVGLIQGMSPEDSYKSALEATRDGSIDERDYRSSKEIFNDITVWLERLAVDTSCIIVNGFFIPEGQNWLFDSMDLFSNDNQLLRDQVRQGLLERADTETDVEAVLLENALRVRDPLVDPVGDDSVVYVSVAPLYRQGFFASWKGKRAEASASVPKPRQTCWVCSDFSTVQGLEQLVNVISVAAAYDADFLATPLIDPTKLHDDEYVEILNAVIGLQKYDPSNAKKYLLDLREYLTGTGERPTFLGKDPIATADQLALIHAHEAASESWTDFVDRNNVIIDGRRVSSDNLLPAETIGKLLDRERPRVDRLGTFLNKLNLSPSSFDKAVSSLTSLWYDNARNAVSSWHGHGRAIKSIPTNPKAEVIAVVDPVSEYGQEVVGLLEFMRRLDMVAISVFLSPKQLTQDGAVPNRFYKSVLPHTPVYDELGAVEDPYAEFTSLKDDVLYVVGIHEPPAWVVMTQSCEYDLDNVVLASVGEDALRATYGLESLVVNGYASDVTTHASPRGIQLELGTKTHPHMSDTIVMANLGYFQFRVTPGYYLMQLEKGASSEIFDFAGIYTASKPSQSWEISVGKPYPLWVKSLSGETLAVPFRRKRGKENADVLASMAETDAKETSFLGRLRSAISGSSEPHGNADVNIFTVASGHLYERFLSIMTASVMRHSGHTVKFWLIENFLSPSFKDFLPTLAKEYGFTYELVTYKWPDWLRHQSEKQREIWGYKILFLDVLFPQTLSKIIFVDSDQIVRTDLMELVDEDLRGAPYGYTPMGDDREETEGFRFWKQGYWKEHLKDRPYHISALYVVDLDRFREMGAGDKLRQHYQQLSADPHSLSNLDQDLPNNLQRLIPIHSLDQDWLWCETWCADEGLTRAKTIDLCNNPLTKEPKLDRARRQIPEWTEYDNAIAVLREKHFAERRSKKNQTSEPVAGNLESDEGEDEHHEL